MVAALEQAGFAGLLIDRRAYANDAADLIQHSSPPVTPPSRSSPGGSSRSYACIPWTDRNCLS